MSKLNSIHVTPCESEQKSGCEHSHRHVDSAMGLGFTNKKTCFAVNFTFFQENVPRCHVPTNLSMIQLNFLVCFVASHSITPGLTPQDVH